MKVKSDDKSKRVSRFLKRTMTKQNDAAKETVELIKNSVSCMYKILLFFYVKIKNILSKFTILTQFLIFFIPLSVILFTILLISYIYFFQRIFKYNYYYTIKHEYFNHLLTGIDDVNFEFTSSLVQDNFGDIETPLFFNIYFKELISLGLLDSPNEKIYPDISNNSETFYDFLDEIYKKQESNGIFSIPKNLSKKYIDDKPNELREIAIIYYEMFPIILYGTVEKSNNINQSFLIAYEFENDEIKTVKNDLYFSFPRYNKDGGINFQPCDNFSEPYINKGKTVHKELISNVYYKENWFAEFDYDFRTKANKINNTRFAHQNLNYENYGSLNSSYIIQSQNYIQRNNKNYIINLIFKVGSLEIRDNEFDYTIFVVNNNSGIFQVKQEKFSDGENFVFSRTNITLLCSIPLIFNYFNYGIYEKDNLFYKNGISYDIFDLNDLNQINKLYSTTEYFKLDTQFFAFMFLYLKFFQEVANIKKIENENYDVDLLLYEDEYFVPDICDKIDFNQYLKYIDGEKLNCWNNKNKMFYKGFQSKHQINGYYSYPYCICLPLYCLNKNKKIKTSDLLKNKYYQKNTHIYLPNKCDNYLKYRENDVNQKSYLNTVSYGTMKYLESEYIRSTSFRVVQAPDYRMVLMTLVNNTNINILYSVLFDDIKNIQMFYTIAISANFFPLFCLIIIILSYRINKVSKIINNFSKKYEDYIYPNESVECIKEKKEKIKENLSHLKQYKKYDKIINEDSQLLIGDTGSEEYGNLDYLLYMNNKIDSFGQKFIANSSNPLSEELFKWFCEYYGYTREEVSKKMKNDDIMNNKSRLISKSNELFNVLNSYSFHAPFVRISITPEFNLYTNAKLNQSFTKFILKTDNIDKHQIILLQNLIYELLSTECITDFGLVMNLDFNYVSDINKNSKTNINFIQRTLFMDLEQKENEKKKYIRENNNEDGNNNTLLVCKKRSFLVSQLEKDFEQDDDFIKENLENAYNFFLINVYYKHLKKILETSID